MSHERRGVLVTTASEGVRHSANTLLRHSYQQRLTEQGLSPILISSVGGEDHWRHMYEVSYGVLFTGGQDIHPEMYGELVDAQTRQTDKARDVMEQTILAWAIADSKPVLGTCRGEQAIAVYFGAKLIKDLPTSPVNHGNGQNGYEDLSKKQHSITIDPPTKLGTIFQQPKKRIPSGHHQAVDVTTLNVLVVSAYARDSVVEAIEHPDLPFVMGIQGHPEVSRKWEPLFAEFAQAVRRHYLPRKQVRRWEG